MAASYDEKNARLAPIAETMHFLIRLVLAEAPQNARILCVGVGTGAEILPLAAAHPHWSFVGVDPSAEMLEICHGRLAREGILERCRLIHGRVQDVPAGADFDAVLSILVVHFVQRVERRSFYRNIHDRLKPGGMFVSTELSSDLDAPESPAVLQN